MFQIAPPSPVSPRKQINSMIEIVERVSRQVVLSEVVGETLQTHAPLGVKMLMTRWGESISLLAVYIWQNSLYTFLSTSGLHMTYIFYF